MRDESRRLVLRNELAEIERLATEIESFGEQAGLPAQAVFDLNLVLEELITNVISYGYEGRPEGTQTIRLDLATVGDELRARVEDDGIAYDPFSREDPDTTVGLEERGVGGLGVLLVRKLMDEATYRRDGERNVVAVRKRIAAA